MERGVDRSVGRSVVCAWGSVVAGVVGVWVGLGLGIGVDFGLVVWFSLACGCLGLGLVLKGRARGVCLLITVGALMGGYTGARVGVVDSDRVDVLAGVVGGGADTAAVRVRGGVVEGVQVAEGRRADWEPVMWAGVRGRCGVAVDAVLTGEGWVRGSGVVRVVMGVEDGDGIRVGDVVEVFGVMRGNRGARNVGDREWDLVANMEGRAGVISVVGGGGISVVGDGGWISVLRRWREVVRDRAMASLGLVGDWEEDSGKVVVGALLLGERTGGAGREVERGFARVGVGHVLAISGFHVALLVGVCVLFLRVLGVERAWVEGLVVCLVFVVMCVLVPVRVPMVRAMVLIGGLMVGRGMGRRYDTMTVLGWVAFGLLVWRPLDVLGLGWQLSVGVTGLLVWMGRVGDIGGVGGKITGGSPVPRGFGGGVLGSGLGWVWKGLRVNGACWLLAMPAVMWHVGVVSVVGVVMAVVVAAMAGWLMVVGYGQVLVGVVWPRAGEMTVGIVEAVSGWVAGFVGWVDGFGWASVRGVNLGVGWTVVATVVIWLVLTRASVVTRSRLVIACVVLVVWGGIEYRVRGFVDGVRVEMVDVGDGSAYLVRSGWETMVYDCGSLDYRVGGTVERVARARGVRTIGVAIVSHDNLDHFNGLVELSRAGVGFDRVYVGAAMERDPSRAWSAVRAELVARGAEVVVMGSGDGFVLGEARVECVSGGEMLEGMGSNDTSLVVRVELETKIGARAVLMTGDVAGVGIGMIGDEDLNGVVVMELPHHGSMNASVRGLVERVDPAVVLQSTGGERVDGRWRGMQEGRLWYASGADGGVGGGAWVEIGKDGIIQSGWSVVD